MRNKFAYLTLSLMLLLSLPLQAVTVANTAGSLADKVTDHSITSLTVTGTMDARDFYFIADYLDGLTTVDLSRVTIVACELSSQRYGELNFAASTLPVGAFAGKPLTRVTLPEGLVEIGEGAFLACTGLTSVTLPSTVTTIGNHAYAACTGLTRVTLPASVTTVGEGAFARCSNMTSFSASGVRQMGATALMDCPKLTSVALGSNLQTMGERVLAGSGIKSLNLSSSTALTSIGDWAFVLTSLSDITLADNVKRLGAGAFLYDTQLTGLTLPSKLQRVSDYMLAGSGLTGTFTTSGIDSIGAYALYNVTGINQVTMDASIEHLGERAMAGMTGMTAIESGAKSVPTLGEAVWDGVNQKVIPLTVPQGTRDNYAKAAQWMEFIVQEAEGWLRGDVNADGEVTIADVNAIISIILGNEADDATMKRADVNEDGEVSVADVNADIDIILSAANYNIPVNTDDRLTMPDVNIMPGDEVTVKINLDNAKAYSALQCDITLPAGLTLVDDQVMVAERSPRHITRTGNMGGTTTRALMYSMALEEFKGNSGAVLTLRLRADEALAGEDVITLSNIMFADNDCVNWHAADAVARVTNSTGVTDITANDDRVWTQGRTLHIATRQAGVAQVANMSGMVREMTLEAGDNQQPIEAGVYIVRLNGKSYKVVAQ